MGILAHRKISLLEKKLDERAHLAAEDQEVEKADKKAKVIKTRGRKKKK